MTRRPLTATFVVVPALPGTLKTITVSESNANAAVNVGWVRAIKTAGWLAFVYGTVTVKHIESGEIRTLTCARA